MKRYKWAIKAAKRQREFQTGVISIKVFYHPSLCKAQYAVVYVSVCQTRVLCRASKTKYHQSSNSTCSICWGWLYDSCGFTVDFRVSRYHKISKFII